MLQGPPWQPGINMGTAGTREIAKQEQGWQRESPRTAPEPGAVRPNQSSSGATLTLQGANINLLFESGAWREDFINSYFRYQTHCKITFLIRDLLTGISWVWGWGFLFFLFYAAHVSLRKTDHVTEYKDYPECPYNIPTTSSLFVIKLISVEDLHRLSTETLRRKSPGLFTEVKRLLN